MVAIILYKSSENGFTGLYLINTNACLISPSILIDWASPFSFYGASGVVIHFLKSSTEIPVCEDTL